MDSYGSDTVQPSMEVFSWHEGLKKWIEIANVSAIILLRPYIRSASRRSILLMLAASKSGMFRPEMLEPMGLPKDVRVLGWGMSLERPTMIKCVSVASSTLDISWSSKTDVSTGLQVQYLGHPDIGGAQDGSGSGQEAACGAIG